MAHTVYVQNDDGTEREVTDEAEITQLYADINAGTLISNVESVPPRGSKRTILNAANAATQRQFDDDAIAAQVTKDARTVMVTIDGGVMLPTEERVELQGPPSEADLALVKTRYIAQQGVANPNHVGVETLADFKARQP